MTMTMWDSFGGFGSPACVKIFVHIFLSLDVIHVKGVCQTRHKPMLIDLSHCHILTVPLSVCPQLTLYSQKFDEFQETLAKSNTIYVHFKQEMVKVGGHFLVPCGYESLVKAFALNG